MENTILKLFKRLILITIGSGLIGNALYIHGLAYYEGYISRLGFEYGFFPLPNSDALFWAYKASRELGASSIIALSEFVKPVVIISIVSTYLFSRIWMESSKKEQRSVNKAPAKINIKLARKVHKLKENHFFVFWFTYVPIRWLFLKEQSFIAFMASYFFLVFLMFLPIFIVIWVYFPMVGLAHGESVGKERIEYFNKNLCGGLDDYWNRCIKIDLSEIESINKKELIEGRLLLSNKNMLGIYTEQGPITVSKPKYYYLNTNKNPCYGGCDEK